MTEPSLIPATPLPGTADPNSLLTLAKYRFITKDVVSDQADFDEALVDALDMLQRQMNRTLLYAQYTERLYVYKNGQCYPSACPIDSAKAIGTASDPDGTSAQYVAQGAGIYVGFLNPLPSMPVFSGTIPMQTDVTYWGGYSRALAPGDTGVTGGGPFSLPSKLGRIIAKTCWYLLNGVTAPGAGYGGVKSISVGGVSISGDLSSFIASDPALERDISRFTRRAARGWQS